MNIFFKIGLPWAISLGFVFYIGLELGSQKQLEISEKEISKINNTVPVDRIPSLKISRFEGDSLEKEKDAVSYPNITEEIVYPAPLPPNLRRIMEGGDMIERMGAYMDALRNMNSSNLPEVINAFEALPLGYGRHLEMKLLMRRWAEFDPISALKYADESLDEKSEKRFAKTEVIAGWATRDSAGAIAWVEQNKSETQNSSERNSLILGLVKGIAENDLESADHYTQNLPQGSAKWQASTYLAQEYAKKETNEAIRWANEYPKDDERMRATILGQLGSKLAQKDLQATAEWAESMPTDKASEQVISNLLSHWSTKNPKEAALWSSQLKDPGKKVEAMKILTNKWSLRDPIATASWLNQFPPSEELDPVVGEFVNRISSRDPEGAMGWASSIVNGDQKQRAVNKVLRSWDLKDPASANEWRKQNGFD